MKWVVFGLMAVVMALLAGCSMGEDPFASDAVVTSPYGSIPFNAKAVSPDGKYILKEVEPSGKGVVAVFEKSSGKEVQKWDILNGNANDLKGLAWAGDSKRFAVMFHGGMKPGITVYEVGKSSEVGKIETDKWYHYMAFGKGTDEMLVSTDGTSRETLKITPVTDASEVAVNESSNEPPDEIVQEPKVAAENKSTEVEEASVTPFFLRKDAAFSPNGSVPEGEKALSPNGKLYVAEVKPFGQGNISVLTTAGKPVQKWTVLPNTNDLKGLAWSPDSKRIAVMYHGGMTPAIQVVQLGKKDIVAAADVDVYYHFMVYDKDGKTLLLAESSNGSVKKLQPKEL